MSKDFSLLLEGLLQGANLTESEASYLMHALAEEKLSSALAGAFLSVLRMKGETADEIRGFASAMRELAIKPTIPDETTATKSPELSTQELINKKIYL